MRTAAEFRGSSASLRRASKRSSSGRVSLLAIALSAARLAAYCLTRPLTRWLRLTALFLAICFSFPPLLLLLNERELEFLEKLASLVIGLRSGGDDDVHAPDLVDLVVVDLREHDVLLEPHGVVAATVERRRLQAPEVLHARQRDRDQPVEELVHAVLAKRDLAAHRHAFAQLEAGDGEARLGRHRLLAGDARQVGHGRVAAP